MAFGLEGDVLITPELKSALEITAYFQDDYSRKLPVISAFRRWRYGHLSSEAFLGRLCADDLAPLLTYESVPPFEGLALLGSFRDNCLGGRVSGRAGPVPLTPELKSVLEIASYFQDDYSLKLPMISAFRRWRYGHLSSEMFLTRLCADDLAGLLVYETVPPLEGLALLRRYRDSYPRR